jgi:hypothetical protein
MKVFISSLISGYGDFRAAAREAIETLGHTPVMAEAFGAKPTSPQLACLQGVRESDVGVLLLGKEYGAVQGTGLSATHEEYREAKGRRPVLAFAQSGVNRAAEQEAFLTEVQGWEEGLFRGSFATPDELRKALIRALRDFELAKAVAPLDTIEMQQRAESFLQDADQRHGYRNQSGSPRVVVSVAGGPRQQVLRPSEIEASGLAEHLAREGMFGPVRIFDQTKGVTPSVANDMLIIASEGQAQLRLDEFGSLFINRVLPKLPSGMYFPIIVEEAVEEELTAALAFAAAVLEHVDRSQRLTHVAIAVEIEASDHIGWKTRQEVQAAGNSMSINMNHGVQRKPLVEVRPRAAFKLDRKPLVEDLVVKLRRSWKG